MSVKTSFAGLALSFGLLAGYSLNHFLPVRPAFAQEPGRILVQGHGRAGSSLKPPGEQFIFNAENARPALSGTCPPGRSLSSPTPCISRRVASGRV